MGCQLLEQTPFADSPETIAFSGGTGVCGFTFDFPVYSNPNPCTTWWENNIDGVMSDIPAVTYGPGGCLTFGCTDEDACNYDDGASTDDGSCAFPAPALDCNGNCLNDADGDDICDEFEVPGCTDSLACNYSSDATDDDDSCCPGPGCCGEGTEWDASLEQCVVIESCPDAPCGEGTIWDAINQECIISTPGDLNFDGCISVSDLLLVLAVHGTCPPPPEFPEGPTDSLWTCGDPFTYWDYDYSTVLIGDQCWFAENLRTTEYTNGDSITHISDDDMWYTTNIAGGYCAPNNNDSLGFTYGLLYNGYCTTDSRGICPEGWHIPLNSEWTAMVDTIGASGWLGEEGHALKAESYWPAGSQGMDAFGFSALPAGHRLDLGAFLDVGLQARWWSDGPGSLWNWIFIVDQGPNINSLYVNPNGGFSVRCTKD